MKNRLTAYDLFNKFREKHFNELKGQYLRVIELARPGTQEKAHNLYRNNFRDDFKKSQVNLADNHSLIKDIEEELDADKTKNFKEIFNQKLAEDQIDKNIDMVENLGIFAAYEEMNTFLIQSGIQYMARKQDEVKDEPMNFKWKNLSSVGFVQLVYGLFHGGFLTNEENEITKLVTDLAKTLNFSLSDNWQILLSESINSRNADYQPKIFQSLTKAFDEHRVTQIEKNKKNKLK